jgi:hypothetical protein
VVCLCIIQLDGVIDGLKLALVGCIPRHAAGSGVAAGMGRHDVKDR